MEGFLETLHEPSTGRLLKNAAPHLHHSFRGEAILSVGKSVDLMARGASGIVNAMPFGCMPGTVVSALVRDMAAERKIPFITVAYDGSAASGTALLLETFMEQARERARNGLAN